MIYSLLYTHSVQSWINFWSFIFWFSFISFVSNINNFLRLLFYSELTWVIIYCYVLILGAINDDITLLSSSIFILGLAGLEYGLGIMLIIIFKNINSKLEFTELENEKKIYNIYNNSNLYINRYIWKS